MSAHVTGGSGERRVLLISPRELLASSLRSVLEPHGYGVHDTRTVEDLTRVLEAARPDVIILDEDLASGAAPALGADRTGAAAVPVLLYSAGHWRSSDPSVARDVRAWDVIEEPIRTQDLLSRLGRLLQLKEMWDAVPAAGEEASSTHVSRLLRVIPMLRSIASRAGESLGCAVVGPTRPALGESALRAHREETIAHIGGQIRDSDVCVWVGPAELAVILYGAGIDGLGQFVGRIARGREGFPEGPRALSAGLVEIEPRAIGRGAADRGSPEADTGFWILGHVEAARGALDRARNAGGGIRVAVPA